MFCPESFTALQNMLKQQAKGKTHIRIDSPPFDYVNHQHLIKILTCGLYLLGVRFAMLLLSLPFVEVERHS